MSAGAMADALHGEGHNAAYCLIWLSLSIMCDHSRVAESRVMSVCQTSEVSRLLQCATCSTLQKSALDRSSFCVWRSLPRGSDPKRALLDSAGRTGRSTASKAVTKGVVLEQLQPAPQSNGGLQAEMDDDDDVGLGDGPVEITELTAPDGSVLRVKYRGVEAGIEVGSKEWKKAKRLADNRASAARSRALARLKSNELEVSLVKMWPSG